jgi:hypothetical protein
MFGLMGESYVGTCCKLSEEYNFVENFVVERIVVRLLRFCMVAVLIRLGMNYLHSVYWLYLREFLRLLLAGRLKVDDIAWAGSVPG